MTLPQQTFQSAIPDLRNIPLERLATLGDSALGNSVALYRQRLQDTTPLSSFTSHIKKN